MPWLVDFCTHLFGDLHMVNVDLIFSESPLVFETDFHLDDVQFFWCFRKDFSQDTKETDWSSVVYVSEVAFLKE